MCKPFDFFAIALLITGLSTGANVARAEDSTAKIDAVVHKNAAQVMQQYNVPGLAIAVSVNGKAFLQPWSRLKGHSSPRHLRYVV